MTSVSILRKVAMPTLTVREIPVLIYEKLRERAGLRRRSMSAETVTLLEEMLLPQPERSALRTDPAMI